MYSQSFVKELEASNQARLSELAQVGAADGALPSVDVQRLLQIALANEISVSELAAAWMPSTSEVDVKIALAQQVGDEAAHGAQPPPAPVGAFSTLRGTDEADMKR